MYISFSLFAVSTYVGNKENLSFFHHCLRFFPSPFSPSSYSFMVFVLAFKNLDLSMMSLSKKDLFFVLILVFLYTFLSLTLAYDLEIKSNVHTLQFFVSSFIPLFLVHALCFLFSISFLFSVFLPRNFFMFLLFWLFRFLLLVLLI
jgi:hypothetical protein